MLHVDFINMDHYKSTSLSLNIKDIVFQLQQTYKIHGRNNYIGIHHIAWFHGVGREWKNNKVIQSLIVTWSQFCSTKLHYYKPVLMTIFKSFKRMHELYAGTKIFVRPHGIIVCRLTYL